MNRWRLAAYGTVVVMILMTLAFCSGMRRQREKDILAENKKAITQSDSVTRSVTSVTQIARKNSDILTKYRGNIRERVIVKHDTILLADVGNRDTVVSPAISQLILADDAALAAKDHALALQDTLIASLHKGITLRDERISLLERAHNPRLGVRSGIVIGAGAVIAILAALHR